MPGFQIARVKVPKERVGDFNEDMAIHIKYAKVIGIEVLTFSDTKLLAPPDSNKKELLLLPSPDSTKFTDQQKRALSVIAIGISTEQGIMTHGEFLRLRDVRRILNKLRARGCITGKDGSYRLSAKMEREVQHEE